MLTACLVAGFVPTSAFAAPAAIPPLCALWKGCDADIDEEIKILLTDGIFTKTKKYYTRRKRNE